MNSPVRAFKSVGGQPIVIDSVKGSRMWDIDGNEYIDYVGSWGPAIIGHADDQVRTNLPVFHSFVYNILLVLNTLRMRLLKHRKKKKKELGYIEGFN